MKQRRRGRGSIACSMVCDVPRGQSCSTTCTLVVCVGGCTATYTVVLRALLINEAIAVLSTASIAAMISPSDSAAAVGATPLEVGLGDGAERTVTVSCSEPAVAERSMSSMGTPYSVASTDLMAISSYSSMGMLRVIVCCTTSTSTIAVCAPTETMMGFEPGGLLTLSSSAPGQ